MKKRKRGDKKIRFGEYVNNSTGNSILKGQWGVSTSSGIGSGRGFGSMGGGLFGGIHHSGYGSSNIGYDAYGEPVVVPYQPVNIDWKREKIDLGDTYKLLGKMKEPVDISKLFKIDGIDKSHLLPSDQQAFDTISNRLMNKYLEEIKQISPNLTQADLMRDDVNYKVNELSMRYKNAISHLFNELKANKERVDKNKGSIDKTGTGWGADNVDVLSQEIDKHRKVLGHSSFEYYKKAYGDKWADVALDELEGNGTFGRLHRLGDIYETQTPAISNNIETHFVQHLEKDKISKITALNQFAFEKDDIAQLSLEKVEKLAIKSLGGIMADNTNNTEVNFTAAMKLRNFGQRNEYLKPLLESTYIDNLGEIAKGVNQIANGEQVKGKVEELKQKVSKGEKLSEQEMSELQAVTQVLNAYMLTNKKRDVKLLDKKIYINETQYKELLGKGIDVKVGKDNNGRHYYIKQEAHAVFKDNGNNDITKQVYEIREKSEDKEKSPIIKIIDKDEYEALKDKDKYEIISEATVPKTLQDVDIDKIYEFMGGVQDIGQLNSLNVGRNIAEFDVYSRMVEQGASKLSIAQEKDVRLRDAVNVSVSQQNNAGAGGEIKEGKLPEWATLTTELFKNVKNGNAASFSGFLGSFVLGGNKNLELADLKEIGSKEHVFGVVNQAIVNSTIGEDFNNPNNVTKYPFYRMKDGVKETGITELNTDKIKQARKEFGYAFTDANGKLVMAKLHDELFEGGGKLFSKKLEEAVTNTANKSGHKQLTQAIDWAIKNPDYLKELFGVDLKDAQDKAEKTKRALKAVVAEEIGKTLDGNTVEQKRSGLSKLLFAYLGKNSNDIVVGAFMTINGERYFVQHTSATTPVSAMLPQDETARNTTFLDRYNFMRPILNPKSAFNYNEAKKGVETYINQKPNNAKELEASLEEGDVNTDVAKNIIAKIDSGKEISEQEKMALKRYLGFKAIIDVLKSTTLKLSDNTKRIDEKIRSIGQDKLEKAKQYLEK